jgi:predicted  nucleic acid-binding Zn-ribbon protein
MVDVMDSAMDDMNDHHHHHHMNNDNDMDDDDNGDGPPESDEVKARKRKERLEQNRISARESRKRKKSMIEELQRTVITLSRENKDLNERNESLRRQLMELASKVRNKEEMVNDTSPEFTFFGRATFEIEKTNKLVRFFWK